MGNANGVCVVKWIKEMFWKNLNNSSIYEQIFAEVYFFDMYSFKLLQVHWLGQNASLLANFLIRFSHLLKICQGGDEKNESDT